MIPKFRAWHKELKEMRSVHAINWMQFESCNVMVSPNESEAWVYWASKNIELMQWTFLKDKHDREIYINDIVRVYGLVYFDDKEYQFYDAVVCYCEELGKLMLSSPQNEYSEDYDDFMVDSVHGQLEILGNIYENPELLNKEVINEL